MPHVIISDPPTPAEVQGSFTPWTERREDGRITEARAAYLRQDGRSVLIEMLCLELGPAQSFFVLVEQKKRQLTVRCFAFPSPQRTPGVQDAVARVARDVLALGGRVERTNLELDRPPPDPRP